MGEWINVSMSIWMNTLMSGCMMCELMDGYTN